MNKFAGGMKMWCVILTLFCTCFGMVPAFSQPDRQTSTDPALLAAYITREDSTEMQKVRSIFYWITSNIAYRTSSSRNSREASYVEPEDTGAIRPLDERVSLAVLHNRKAVCDGYARLFKTLCKYAGIEAEVVFGYGKTQPFRAKQRFNANHSWNTVRIDSIWHVLDVTWASGYLNWQGTDFIQHLDEQYFLSDPAEFIREHYPDDLRWSLLEKPPLIGEFRFSPYRHRSFSKYRFTGYSPSNGILDIFMGDSVALELTTPPHLDPASISSDPFLDTSVYNTANSVVIAPTAMHRGKALYQFTPAHTGLEWLYILFNDDVVLRYRLQVKNREAVAILPTPAGE